MRRSKFLLVVKLFRLPSVFAMSLFILLPLAYATGDIAFSIGQTLPYSSMIAGEIALNDCCDVKKDRISKPQRPLVSGKLNYKRALWFSITVILVSIIFGICVYHPAFERLLIFLSTAAILSFYNLRFSWIALIKTFLTAFATVLSLCFPFTYLPIPKGRSVFLVAAFLFIVGRELMMDIRDVDGDSQEGYQTLALVFGEKKVGYAAVALIGAATFLCFGYTLFFSTSVIKCLLLPIIVVLEFFCCIGFLKAKTMKRQNQCILLFWIPMLLMLCALFL